MKKPFKVLATSLLAGAMFSSSLTAFAAEEEKPVPPIPIMDEIITHGYIPFKDVKEGTEAFDAISHYYQEKAFIKGIKPDLFGVNEPIKRVDAAVVLGNINPLTFGVKVEKATFKDLPARAVEAVSFLQHYNVVQGKSATIFGAADNITRGEAAMMIHRAYKAKLAEKSSSSAPFTDVSADWDLPNANKSKHFSDVTGRYVEAVDALTEAGVINGKSEGKFGTSQNITRSELIIILYRLDSMIYGFGDSATGDSSTINYPSSEDGVTISLDKETYSPSEKLKVTLTNTSDYTQVGIFKDFDLEVKKNGIWRPVPWNPEIASPQEIIQLNAKDGVLNTSVYPHTYFQSNKFPVGEYRLVQTFERVNGSTTSFFIVAAKFKVAE